MFYLVDDPNNVAWFLMGDFLRLSLLSGGFGPLGFCCCSFWERKKLNCRTLNFSLIIVKSLQLCRRGQIAESHKYCLMRVIVFLWHMFSLIFCFSQVGNLRLISLHKSASSLIGIYPKLFIVCWVWNNVSIGLHHEKKLSYWLVTLIKAGEQLTSSIHSLTS